MSVLLRGGTQFQFGSYLLDAANRSLLCDGQPVVITSKTFDLPLLLVTYRDRLVTKAEIRAALWGEVHVEEANIHQQISTLRRDSLIYQLRLVLAGISPMIWRRLLVSSETTIA